MKQNSSLRLFFIILFTLILGSAIAFSGSPTAVSTYHCISVYWTPENNNGGEPVSIKYRVLGEQVWHDGFSMKYHPVNPPEAQGDYRGSIVNLQPDTNYEILLTVGSQGESATFAAQTMNETVPIATSIVVFSHIYSNMLTITHSGTENGYILYDGTGATIDMNNAKDQGIVVDASYVILRGFTIKNTKKNGILIKGGHHIIIEDCDISKWGEHDENGFGVDLQMGIIAPDPDTHRLTIQRCKIHDPNWDTNSWTELHNGSYHPAGPQAIGFANSLGGNVIRYNEIWSEETHYLNDALGYGSNGSYKGFPGPDSDIYGNYIANTRDDGIESEGGNQNVRIWNNYIENTYIGIGNAPTSIGPLYVWRNVIAANEFYSVKMGYSNSINWMTGHMYLINNTILHTPTIVGGSGLGTINAGQRDIMHCTTRNNILQVKITDTYSISSKTTNTGNDYDYDLLSASFPAGHEAHGIAGTPTYSTTTPFVYSTKTGNFQLVPTSLGYDAGVAINNFCDKYTGNAPDMGAHEADTESMLFGTSAYFDPPPTNYFPIVKARPATQNVMLTQSAMLKGTAKWISTGPIFVNWSMVSGPGSITFSNPTSEDTTASFSALGTYVIKFEASDSLVNGSENVTVVVKTNSYPSISVSPTTQTVSEVAYFTSMATDDGLPNGWLDITWSKISGPGIITFSDPDLLDTSATFSSTGTYVIKFKASDTLVNSSQNVTVIVKDNEAPVVSTSPTSASISMSQVLNLSAIATDDGLPNGQLTLTWEKKSGPGTITFSNPNSLNTTATFSAPGTYQVRFKAFDSQLYGSKLVPVIVQ